jgi:hypothetical protein
LTSDHSIFGLNGIARLLAFGEDASKNAASRTSGRYARRDARKQPLSLPRLEKIAAEVAIHVPPKLVNGPFTMSVMLPRTALF